ncbi:MAG: hypothetical protein IJO98_06840 [Clostridia bacterium]|nr:hypothetical protein [Clostridia bacterium]
MQNDFAFRAAALFDAIPVVGIAQREGKSGRKAPGFAFGYVYFFILRRMMRAAAMMTAVMQTAYSGQSGEDVTKIAVGPSAPPIIPTEDNRFRINQNSFQRQRKTGRRPTGFAHPLCGCHQGSRLKQRGSSECKIILPPPSVIPFHLPVII